MNSLAQHEYNSDKHWITKIEALQRELAQYKAMLETQRRLIEAQRELIDGRNE
jgi:uncharacterized damage-inducible protein DinB